MEQEEKYLGYLKYHGEMVDEGFMDARKSAQALLGFDEAVRFFVFQQVPDLRKTDFEFPVRVKKGSWEIVIPELVDIIKLAGSVVVTAYGVKAAQKMAEHDFDGIGIRDIFKKSLLAIHWVIKIGKHLGDLSLKKFESVKFKDNNQLIGIKNSEGDLLYVPKEYLDFYVASNPRLLGKISELVEEQRVLSVGVYHDGQLVEETVTRKYRSIFTHEEEEHEEMLLPELEHGQEVALEGEVTKGNEMSNTMGLNYQGHILTMLPETGSIVRFKPSLFLKCSVRGLISRLDDKGRLDAKKPKIIFSRIEPIESDTTQSSLFE